MDYIKVSKIVIPKSFSDSKPQDHKLNSVRSYVEKHGELDKPIVLDGQMLVDNYIRYLVAKDCGFKEVPYITLREYREQNNADDNTTTYIIGKFSGSEKEYTWRLTKNIDINVGDYVLVKSKFKDGSDVTVVNVVKVFTSDDPHMLRHKPIIKKLKRKPKGENHEMD